MKNIRSTFSFLTIFLVFALVGCGPQVQTGAEAGINIEFEAMGDAQAVGETMLMVKLTDISGAPINDAALNVQGDMTHAGMAPVIRDVEGGEDGVYSVPFEWTMGGDWIVTVIAVLNDGTEVEETFDLSVASEGEMAMDHDGHGEHKEGEGHEGHGEDKEGEDHDGYGEGEMAMDDDLATALEALDVSAIHAIDDGMNDDGTIEAGYAETVGSFMMAVSMIEWPEMYGEDVESLNSTLTSLKEALDAEDLDAAQPLANEAHDKAHTLVEAAMEMSDGHDH